MPSYIEENNTIVLLNTNTTTIKPILFTNYTSETKYTLNITYEDSTTKTVELVQKDVERPYKFIYKKEGKLETVTGIPTVYEINENSKFCDFVNKTMDSEDLLFIVDCSDKYQLKSVKFYLKDIRDIVDIVTESLEDEEEENQNISIPLSQYTLYPILLNGKKYNEVVECTVNNELKVTLSASITKNNDILESDKYSGFRVLSVESPAMFDYTTTLQFNMVPLIFTEESLNREIKVIIGYFVNEIGHPIFEEFRVKATR